MDAIRIIAPQQKGEEAWRVLQLRSLVRLGALGLVMFAAGCGALRGSYTTPGRLYVEVLDHNGWAYQTDVIRGGHTVAELPLSVSVARDRPSHWITASDVKSCEDAGEAPEAFRISPDGRWALCTTVGGGVLLLVDLAHRGHDKRVAPGFHNNADNTAFSWLDDNHFIATVLDHKMCPYAHLYDYFPTRIETFDVRGRLLSKGPCANGVVAGQGRFALQSDAPNPNNIRWELAFQLNKLPQDGNDGYDRFHSTWSVDWGKTWHAGLPLAFDGNDRLLYAGPFEDNTIYTEDGTVAFRNVVYSVQWSR
jgi:hypothetical protein